MRCFQLFFIMLASFSCATLSTIGEQRAIGLDKIANLNVGLADKEEIKRILGKPTRTAARSGSDNVWIYCDENGAQTASVVFDDSDILIGAVWVPSKPENFISLQTALTRFKNSKFEIEEQGWDAQGHYYSNDKTYRNKKDGISFLVNDYDKMVTFVGFGIPSVRQPAKQ